MLVSFSVANFRSFSGEQTFSMVASSRLAGTHDDHAVPIPNSTEKVLRTAVIYGANGAGKSNLFKGLRYIERMALRPMRKNSGTKREPFSTSAQEASLFDLQFIANEKLYRFGFKVDDDRILEEWLLEVKRKDRIIYERITDSEGVVTVKSRLLEKSGGKLAAIATVGGPQNQTFLATINATLEKVDLSDELAGILEWFKEVLVLIAPNESYGPLGHELWNDQSLLNFAGEFLKASSTGVDHLVPVRTEISEEGLKAMLPKDLADKLLERILEDDDGDTGIIRLPNGVNVLIEKASENHFFKIEIQANHTISGRESFTLNLKDESDGTKRLLDFIPALHKISTDSTVYVIDEIDRSMHPMLVWKILEFFLRKCASNRSQIIVTTHESNLLDLDLLRRDEIWFAEKDRELSTQIYSLSEFAVRKDSSLRKHYLEGRFGGVPFLGQIEKLQIERGEE